MDIGVLLASAADRFPWALLIGVVAWIARMWATGIIVHKREYEAMVDDRDRWRQLALDQNRTTTVAVTAVEKVATAAPRKERTP